MINAKSFTTSGLLVASLASALAIAQTPEPTQQIEEMVVMGRLQSSAGNIIAERMEGESMTDIIGAEQIGRIGDSNVASALRRVPGVTLVDDKFIYVRGLGERYSSSLLNGAQVPSPDLTRNVLPLDIFPTSVVESLAIQKTYSADRPAAFGGGNVDIRTRGIPSRPTLSFEIGTSYNSETIGDGLSYKGGSDDWLGTDDGTRELPEQINQAVRTYGGSLDSFTIRDRLVRESGFTLSPVEALVMADQINRELAVEMNREVDVSEGSLDPNYSLQMVAGNNLLFDNGWEIGFLAGGSYENSYSNSETLSAAFSAPDEEFNRKMSTTHGVNITGNLALGLRPNNDNEITTTSLFIRNTDDRVSITNSWDQNRRFSTGLGWRDFDTRFEKRELRVNQIHGRHSWTPDTKNMLGLGANFLSFLDYAQFNWYVSDATAVTDIPGETNVGFTSVTDPVSGALVSSRAVRRDSTVDYRFTELDDQVDSAGWSLSIPLDTNRASFELSTGYDWSRKARTYQQMDIVLGSTNAAIEPLLGENIDTILSDENILDSSLGFRVNLTSASARSYLAATQSEAAFGKIEMNWSDRWRAVVGARWEQYIQVGLPWQPFNYSSSQISTDPVELERAVFRDDAVYPSLSVVYMVPEFWAQDFQLRFSASETVVRPDLREITETSYQDPINSEFLIFGNQDVIPSDVLNLDLRAEWFFANGDNFTVSAFYKDIENPIEFFERPASDRKRAAQIQNAEAAEVYGVEVEWLKDLSFLGTVGEAFFLAGNLTLAESELVAGDLPTPPTNSIRPLSGASEYVLNMQLGFDSFNGRHAATLGYNIAGERIFAAGINGSPDSYEQPFNSLDMTYSFYPGETLTVKLKLKNLLDEQVVVEQAGISVFEENIGLSGSLNFEWKL